MPSPKMTPSSFISETTSIWTEEEPLFSQGTFFNFRQRLIEHGLDQVLFDRTVQLARETGGFSGTHLRAAFDASLLWGAGRVEDTFNLIGRATRSVVRTAGVAAGCGSLPTSPS